MLPTTTTPDHLTVTPGVATAAPTTPSMPSRATVPTQRPTTRRGGLPASGPGVRWTLSAKVRVRFTKDLTRLHSEEKPYRNLVKFEYLDDAAARPSDEVLAELTKLASLPSDHPLLAAGRRCWLLTQTTTGWTLALELRGGPMGRHITPGRDADGVPLGVAIDPVNLPGTLAAARELIAAALSYSDTPDAPVHPLVLEQLRTTWA